MAAKENKFYWAHGVSREEVTRALSDRTQSILYRQGVRRLLVIFAALSIVALTTSALLADGKIQSYLEGIAFALALVLYFVIRKSCRLIAEAPAELLDERLVEIRNQTYVIAYAILAFTVGIAIGVVWASDLAWTSEVISEPILDRGMITPFVMAFFMLGILLPNMVLAWNLPSENQP
jgi:MFS family permease